MGIVRLSKNFTLAEFTRSKTAQKRGIDNTPDEEQLENLTGLVEAVLQPVRNKWGRVSIFSGFRSKLLNAELKRASPISQHMEGEAADIVCRNMARVFWWIAGTLDFDQLIWEYGCADSPDWIHVSFVRPENGKNRRQIIRAVKKRDGSTEYREMAAT